MRRVLTAMACAVLLALGVAACGSSGGSAETPASTPTTTPTATDTAAPGGAGDAGAGAAIYTSNCAGCHSTDGSGGSGPNIQGKDDLAAIVAQVTGGGSSMPAFEGQLSTAEIQSVAEYVANGFK
ncbi:MAG: cytochrome c [Actinobacteria bacterium]|nr:cytochrome c [Actinomycetota bacterium]